MGYKTAKDIILNAVSMASDVASDAIDIERLDGIGLLLEWTGTPDGDVTIEIRTEDSDSWVAMEGSSIDTTVYDGVFYDIDKTMAASIRVKYTRTASTGNLTCRFFAKAGL